MPATITECVKLFAIPQVEACLFAHPFAQTRFQGALGHGIEGTKGQGVRGAVMRHHQHQWPLLFDRYNRRRKADADG